MVRATQVMDMMYYARTLINDAVDTPDFIKRYQYNYGLAAEDQDDNTNTNLAYPAVTVTVMDGGNHSDEHSTSGNKQTVREMETTKVRLFTMPIEVASKVRPEIKLKKAIEVYANLMVREYELTFDIVTNGPLESEVISDSMFYTYDLNNWVIPMTRDYETAIEIGTVVNAMDTTFELPILDTLMGNVNNAPDGNWNGVRIEMNALDNENNLVADHHVEPLVKLNGIQQTQSKSDSRYTMNINMTIRFTQVTDIFGILPGYVDRVNSKISAK